MTPARLPVNIEIDGVMHCQCWRDETQVITQNYTEQAGVSDDPLRDRRPQIKGQNLFHLFPVDHSDGGETLGELIGSYSSVTAAIAMASRQ
jgi:hypothetical protein